MGTQKCGFSRWNTSKDAYSNGGPILADATGAKTLTEGDEHLDKSERKDGTHGVVPAATE